MSDNFKPTMGEKPTTDLGKKYATNFNKTMKQSNVKLSETEKHYRTDEMLDETEVSLKKKIFSLPKMESLVFSDPMLSAEYDKMAENGSEKYGYHYNETVINILFNDFVLTSPKYLQKYKNAIPKKKKRRDASGITQMQKAGKEKMEKSHKDSTKTTNETTGSGGGVGGNSGQYSQALDYKLPVDETTGSASSGAYVGPAVWGDGDLMHVKGKASVKTKPIVVGGTIIQESKINYLINPKVFERFINELNEDVDKFQNDLGSQYKKTHPESNKGLGVSSLPQSTNRLKKEKNISDNTMLYVDQDVDQMPDEDVNILHNDMTKNNSYFPHPKNPNLPEDGISGKVKNENRTKKDNFVINKTKAFSSDSVKDWDDEDINTELNTIHTGDPDKANLKLMETKKNIGEKAVSVAQEKAAAVAYAAKKGEIPTNKLKGASKEMFKMSKSDLKDFASTKLNGLPNKVKENKIEEESMLDDNPTTMALKAEPTGTQSSNVPQGTRDDGGGGISESHERILSEINNELKAFSIYHDKLKKMAEDRKPSALILRDRLGSENEKHFKKDFKDSSVSQLIDLEKELQYKDQQTDIGNDPYKLGKDIEEKAIKSGDMKSGEALKNVGNSANEKGDEIPKRNMTKEEQEAVTNYRLGLGDFVYDNEPGKKFEDRMKKDMGDKLYQERQKKLEIRGKAPMYNKDTQPTSKGKETTQFSKFSEMNESFMTGRYFDALNKSRLLETSLNEIKIIANDSIKDLFNLDFRGLGNTYNGKTIDNKVTVNEDAVKAIRTHKFYTNGKDVFAVKAQMKNLNENKSTVKESNMLNEQVNKMKHLLGYNADKFTNTKNVKINRGF